MNLEPKPATDNSHHIAPPLQSFLSATTTSTEISTTYHTRKNNHNIATATLNPLSVQVVSDSEYISNNNNNTYNDISYPSPTSTFRQTSTPTPSVTPSPTRRSSRRVIKKKIMTDMHEAQSTNLDASDDEDIEDKKSQKGGKSRRELPSGAVATLKAWLLSPEHFTHPYPTPQDQIMLMQKTGIDKKQLKNWFTNARRRIWKPMLKKQLEQGKMTQTGTGAVVTLTQPIMTSAPTGQDYPQIIDHTQVIQQTYQHALQQPSQQQQHQQYDSYGNPSYQSQQQHHHQQQLQPPPQATYDTSATSYFQQNQFNIKQPYQMAPSNSIGSLPQMPGATPPGSMSNLNKTDSHAVLMELFARDQDLVRQATEGAKQRGIIQTNGSTEHNQIGLLGHSREMNQLGSQHPMSKMVSGGSSTLNKLGNVPSLNSWPHFSSVSSLNNLGTMTGVKSITNMSGADLVSQGSLNKKGNLAQVKSIENMGRADSYAFLEVFFDSASGSNINTSSQVQRGVKREREEDDNVGLSLDGDDQSPSVTNAVNNVSNQMKIESSTSISAPLPSEDQDKDGLKRAYDDALAARGLISVSRSSEKLTDLALPAKMQRTISQEYLKSMNAGGTPTTFTSFSFNPSPAPAPTSLMENSTTISSKQSSHHGQQIPNHTCQNPTNMSSNSRTDSSVEVPATTKCALCNCINVDTQLRPCGCMFHGRCLKPSLQNAMAPPKCPIDNITMQSAVLAVPTDDNHCNSNGMVNNNFTSSSYGVSVAPLTTTNSSKEISNKSSV